MRKPRPPLIARRGRPKACPRSPSVKKCWDSCSSCRRFRLKGHELVEVPSYVFNETIRFRLMRSE